MKCSLRSTLWAILILGQALGGALSLRAQSGLEWMTSRAWRIQDGLPDQVIQAIAQTPDHYLWLGTKLGLVRFDGTHFLDYGGEVAPVLHDFGVDCITVARDGSLWLGTGGGGIVHLVHGGGRTYGLHSGLSNGLVRTIFEDEKGRIWAGADHGLYRLDSVASAANFVRIDDVVLTPNLGVHAIIGDGAGGIWAGGTRLLHFYGPGKSREVPWKETELPHQPASWRIWQLALAPGGTLWVSTLGGLYSKQETGPLTRDRRVPGGALSLHLDSQQRLWIGALSDGLYLIDAHGTVSHATAPNQLASDAVLSILEDGSHDIWVGTQSGLTRLSATGMHLTSISGSIDAEYGSVSVDTDRSLWVCSGKLIHLVHGKVDATPLPSLSGVAVRTVMRERSGAFWVGTLGQGAYRLDTAGNMQHYTTEIGTNYIRGFLETPQDGVWIASDGGVARWRGNEVTSFQDAPGAPHAAVTAMAPGAPGELWVGTYLGLTLLRGGAYVSSPAAIALGSHMVWALHSSNDGILWIGTEAGLFLWRNGELRRLALDEKMEGKTILSILEDGRGRIWLSGPTTVLRAKRALVEQAAEGQQPAAAFTPELFAVARETGAELSGGTMSSATLDGSDGAWFASHDGPLHIWGGGESVEQSPPPIMLGRVSVDGRRIDVSGPVVLQPTAKSLEIEATPVSLSARPGLHLRRRLIGFDAHWTPITSLQAASYTNLPPGKYTYRVEAGWDGSPAVSVLELPVVQLAHFYRRPYFLVICAGALILMGFFVHFVQVRRVTSRYRLISEERTRVAREIHDTVVQSCIGISSLLEAVAVRQAQSPQVIHGQDLLDAAREQVAITIVEARDAVWNLRHLHDDGSLAHSLRSMLNRMTAIQSTVVKFECVGVPTPLDRETEHELLMTAREALHNAIVHAASRHIFLTLRYEDEDVTVTIRDDGRGFEVDATGYDAGEHFGLVGMRERMERIGGSCTIRSIPGCGVTVTLKSPLPLRRNPRSLQHLL